VGSSLRSFGPQDRAAVLELSRHALQQPQEQVGNPLWTTAEELESELSDWEVPPEETLFVDEVEAGCTLGESPRHPIANPLSPKASRDPHTPNVTHAVSWEESLNFALDERGYALPDLGFDRSHGLRSAVVRLGERRAILLAKLLHGVTVPALAPGQAWTQTFTCKSGTLTAVADATKVVAESDEGNNTATRTVTCLGFVT